MDISEGATTDKVVVLKAVTDEPDLYYLRQANGSNPTNNKNGTSTESVGLGSTKTLVIFLVVVFAVLLLFLALYYYFVKGTRASSGGDDRIVQKSTSGSINEERARNIFAHPERQLAVDQSARASPSEQQEQEQQQQETLTTTTTTAPTGGQRGDPKQASVSIEPKTVQPTGEQQQQQQLQRQQPPQQQQQVLTTKKSKSKSKSLSGKKISGRSTGQGSMVGTLANLRETLKETNL